MTAEGTDGDDNISFRGNRNKWLDFTHYIKKKKGRKATVWKELEPLLNQYLGLK